MNDKEQNIFLSRSKDSLMWMVGISALYLLGLTIQVYAGIEPLSYFISIFFMIMTIGLSALLGSAGMIVAVVWNILQIIIYTYEYIKYQEYIATYLLAMSCAALLITLLFWAVMYKVKLSFDDYRQRINFEKTRRLSKEETNLVNEAVQRTNLIVRHSEMPSRQVVSQALDITRSTGIDTLTTLPNRTRLVAHIDTLIDDCISKSQSSSDDTVLSILPIYVIHINMDKTENFTLNSGHKILDLFLQSMAHRIREVADSSDMVGRVSGTEFAIVTHRGITEDALEFYIGALCKAAASSFKDVDGNSIVTFSAGYSQYPRDGRFPGLLMSKAEAALCDAQKEGGNKILSYSEPNSKPSGFMINMTNNDISKAINQAFDKDELHMVYQPRIDRDKNLVGFEAFIRWGEVKTAELLDAAVLTGDIYRIGKFSFTNAMKKLAEINTIDPRLEMTINLSTIQLRNSKIVEDIKQAATSAGCNLENLIFDVPEDCIIVEPEITKPVLEQFSEMGIQIALDNFGRGYSSLNNIPLLPVGHLKLDGDFTSDLKGTETTGILASTIIYLLDEIDLPVSATGVGSKRQFELLMGYGCSYFQGQYICDPLPQDSLKKYILNYDSNNQSF